jgi:hypothetical protein
METYEHNGIEYRFEIEPDYHHGAPWEECDGHGPVSEWTRRAKLPGELVLNQDRDSYRYYDFQAACKIARRDGWDAAPYNKGQETARQQAAKAAMANYNYLRQWCNDVWSYVGVVVYERCPSCNEWRSIGSLWGIEDSDRSYIDEVVQEIIEEHTAQEVAA